MALNKLPPGIIAADEAYTLTEFRRRTRLGERAWRAIRHRVRVCKVGRKMFVLGADWLAFLASVGDDEATEGTDGS